MKLAALLIVATTLFGCGVDRRTPAQYADWQANRRRVAIEDQIRGDQSDVREYFFAEIRAIREARLAEQATHVH